MPLNLVSYPSEEEPTCADLGAVTGPGSTLTGRDVTMLQKQYFGGLQLSQGVYDWATTPFKGLEDVLARPSRHDIQRSGGHHSIICKLNRSALLARDNRDLAILQHLLLSCRRP